MSHAKVVTVIAGLLTLSIAACSGQQPLSPSSIVPGEAGALAGESSADAVRSLRAADRTVPVSVFSPLGDGAQIPGATSMLVRNAHGVSMNLRTSGLTPGAAYTLWVLIFNDEASCSGSCGLDDFLANQGGVSLQFGSGHVVGASGQAAFGASLAAGNTAGPACPGPFDGCGPGLLDPLTAAIHAVIRVHGPAIPELLSDQISSFNGGCPPNACANVQVAVHSPLP